IERDDDTRVVRQLAGCGDEELHDDGIRLPGPVSPHLAAQLSQTTIEIGALTSGVRNESPALRWIVEGAGGVLVPINESELMIDLMLHLQLSVVAVARAELGTINHTLLTLE